MRNLLLIISIAVTALLTSCKSDLDIPGNNSPVSDGTFNFSTTKTVQMVVSVDDAYNNQYFYTVEVFDRNPFSTDTVANLISAGVANGANPLNTKIVIPAHIGQIYVLQTDPLQRKTLKIFDVSEIAESLNCNFGINTNTTAAVAAPRRVVAADPQATSYTLPDSYTTLGSGAVTLSGDKYYVPAGVTNSQINFGWLQNSELYVAGNVSFSQSFYMPSNCKLIVLNGGSVTFNVSSSFEQPGNTVAVYPSGSLTFNQSSAVGLSSTLINNGTVNMNSGFEVRANSVMVNNGVINASLFTMTNNSTFKNNGTVNVQTDFVMNSNSTFNNDGVLKASSTIRSNNITAVINNHNTLQANFIDMINGGVTLNNYCKVLCSDFGVNGGIVNSYDGSLISCKNIYANNTVFTLTGSAILKARDNDENSAGNNLTEGVTWNYGVVINGVAVGKSIPVVYVRKITNKNAWQVLSLTGNMQYIILPAQNPDANFYKTIGGGVSFLDAPTVTIPGSDCNEGGVNANNGSGTPTNPTFPLVVKENNQYTFAMEDLWPNLGDYDMNDFVFEIHNIQKTINSESKVLSMTFDIQPLAAGSTKNIAAAVQFDNMSADQVTVSSTDNIATTETGQSLANLILFPNVHALFGKSSPVIVNTYPQVAKITSKNYTFTITFSHPVSSSDVIISNMNFYVVVGDVNSSDRKEVHLAGYKPSDKVKSATNGYKDANNMVWAIMLPVGNFAYPTESTKIFNAYPQFNSWAASGGKSYTDWYLHPSGNSSWVYSK